MMFRLIYFGLLFYILSGFGVSAEQDGLPILNGPYLGQEPPDNIPKIFAPDFVSTRGFNEYGCTFSPDGKEFYFSRRKGPYTVDILVTRQTELGWTKPEKVSFTSGYSSVEPHYSPVEDKIFFQTVAPLPQSWNLPYNKARFKLWAVEKANHVWGKSYPFSKKLSSGIHGQVSCANSKTIYATYNSKEIISIKYKNSKYQNPEKIHFASSNESDVFAHPCIAPDESYIIFCSGSKGSYGKADLWISFSNDDGSWGGPINLGDKINTLASEGFPSLSYDGKYIFFERNDDIYWVDAGIIEKLKPE